jgi:hypothetical protein
MKKPGIEGRASEFTNFPKLLWLLVVLPFLRWPRSILSLLLLPLRLRLAFLLRSLLRLRSRLRTRLLPRSELVSLALLRLFPLFHRRCLPH